MRDQPAETDPDLTGEHSARHHSAGAQRCFSVACVTPRASRCLTSLIRVWVCGFISSSVARMVRDGSASKHESRAWGLPWDVETRAEISCGSRGSRAQPEWRRSAQGGARVRLRPGAAASPPPRSLGEKFTSDVLSQGSCSVGFLSCASGGQNPRWAPRSSSGEREEGGVLAKGAARTKRCLSALQRDSTLQWG